MCLRGTGDVIIQDGRRKWRENSSLVAFHHQDCLSRAKLVCKTMHSNARESGEYKYTTLVNVTLTLGSKVKATSENIGKNDNSDFLHFFNP